LWPKHVDVGDAMIDCCANDAYCIVFGESEEEFRTETNLGDRQTGSSKRSMSQFASPKEST